MNLQSTGKANAPFDGHRYNIVFFRIISMWEYCKDLVVANNKLVGFGTVNNVRRRAYLFALAPASEQSATSFFALKYSNTVHRHESTHVTSQCMPDIIGYSTAVLQRASLGMRLLNNALLYPWGQMLVKRYATVILASDHHDLTYSHTVAVATTMPRKLPFFQSRNLWQRTSHITKFLEKAKTRAGSGVCE